MAERKRKCRLAKTTKARLSSVEGSSDVEFGAEADTESKPARNKRSLRKTRSKKRNGKKRLNASHIHCDQNKTTSRESHAAANKNQPNRTHNDTISNEGEKKQKKKEMQNSGPEEIVSTATSGGRIVSLNEVTDRNSPTGTPQTRVHSTEQLYQPPFVPLHHQHHYHPFVEATEPQSIPQTHIMPPHAGPIPVAPYTMDYCKDRTHRPAPPQDHCSSSVGHAPSVRPSYQQLTYRSTEQYSPSQPSSPRYMLPSVSEVSSTSSFASPPTVPFQYEERRIISMPDEDGDLPLHIAVAKAQSKEVRCLLHLMNKYQIHVDKFNNLRQTPLHIAVITSHTEIMSLLLESGASPCAPDRRGNTAVHLAAKCADKECLAKLLENSQSEDAINSHNYDGFTPLHLAIFKNDPDFIKVLLCQGADVDIVDGTSGRGPLFHAIDNGFEEVVELLLNFGANVNLPNYAGITPLVVATDKGNKTISSMLISRGAMITLREDYF